MNEQQQTRNGAENLLDTLVASGIEVCFANPGTSEMQLVSAIGNRDDVRAILCLFEGVVSGAADGYGRMAGKPALTLLHVGSGFSNSMANLHNAKRASSPIVNMVGDHATHHLKYDSPLTSDVAAHARISSSWVRASESADDLASAGAEAVQAARTGAGRIATFIAPANHAWEPATDRSEALDSSSRPAVDDDVIDSTCAILRQEGATGLLLGGPALTEENLEIAGRIARATGARILCETFPARLQRGVGRVKVERLPYFAEQVAEYLQPFQNLILVGSKAPVAFFAYPGKKSWLTPEHCHVEPLASIDDDIAAALAAAAKKLDATEPADVTKLATELVAPQGVLSPLAIGQSLTLLLPDNAIVSDEAATCGMALFPTTETAPKHDWLTLTGGAIGQGLPLSLGAAIACPDRKVVALQADGSAMYTIQSLWTMARENTDVTVVIMNNRSYAILNIELARVGAGAPTPKTLSMLSLGSPNIDWCAVSEGLGVPALRSAASKWPCTPRTSPA